MKLTKNRVGILVKQYCRLEWPKGCFTAGVEAALLLPRNADSKGCSTVLTSDLCTVKAASPFAGALMARLQKCGLI